MKRAGLAGKIVGVDYGLAERLAPKHCDRETFMALLLVAEQGMLAGVAKSIKD